MEYVSVKLDMVHRLPHSRNLYAEENTAVYRHIVEATLGTQYSATIVPIKCAENLRGAYLSLKYQFAGPACWDQEIKDTMNFLVTPK